MIRNRFFLISFIFLAVVMISCQQSERTYMIETNMGNIQVKLYEKTPLHKENFEKLVAAKMYENVLFHRIISGFMIQTGDPMTKPDSDSESLKNELNYTIPAEFVPEYFHKRGALAAARTNNPQKRSSPSQFYIVHGRKYDNDELNQLDIKFSESQRMAYKMIGGAPFLDQDYTVFGEVVKGLEVVDAIASVPTGAGNFPLKDVRILRIVKK